MKLTYCSKTKGRFCHNRNKTNELPGLIMLPRQYNKIVLSVSLQQHRPLTVYELIIYLLWVIKCANIK